MNKLDAVSNNIARAASTGAEGQPAAAAAEATDAAVTYQSGDVTLRSWRDQDGRSFFNASRAGGASTGPKAAETKVYLAGLAIDPASPPPPGLVADPLLAKADAGLQIVQFVSQSLPGFTEA